METPTPDRGDSKTNARSRTRADASLQRALRAPRAATSGVADVLRYWRAERSTLRQGMVSLSISALGNIPTGLALGAMENRLKLLPGLFILIPAAIGMRGAIFGALGSRLGTSMQAGLLRMTLDRQGRLAQNIWASILLTFTTSLFLAVLARAITAALGMTSVSIWDFVVISVLGGVASSAIVLVFTVGLAWFGAKRGWDLDSVAAPLITFIGDLITMPALFAASY
ncbi:MAG TPA: magnesium transporter, partial [Actinomycetota bacterium]|nr:magnesium transporter [Actinomycetota bacterium]